MPPSQSVYNTIRSLFRPSVVSQAPTSSIRSRNHTLAPTYLYRYSSSTITTKMGDAGPQTPTSTSTPSFYLPHESVPQSHTLLAFPNLPGCYRSESSTLAARKEVLSIARAISQFQPTVLYAHPEHSSVAREMLSSPSHPKPTPSAHDIEIRESEVDNLWIRDLGPIFLHSTTTPNKTSAALSTNFNYWGHKAEETIDGTFAPRILASHPAYKSLTHLTTTLVTEGGALEVDGEGTLMVCDTSILNDNRNPDKSKTNVEEELKRVLGVTKIIWLKGIAGFESTDWHVDAWARFVRPGLVMLSKPPTNTDARIWELFHDARRVLAEATDARGQKLEVVEVEEPDQEKLRGGAVDGMITSYVNYLLVNGGVVMARFGDERTDGEARKIVEGLWPERRVVQVEINELPRLGGGIHCATQQVPV